MKAIAAMAQNRVIGRGAQLPWHLPEDFRWFKQMTTGHVVVMGRKTFESIGKPLPNRTTIILTRQPLDIPGVTIASDISEIDAIAAGREVFICGGAEVYRQLLPRCSDLYLTLVKTEVEGDAHFPPFEAAFDLAEVIRDTADFQILHYRRHSADSNSSSHSP